MEEKNKIVEGERVEIESQYGDKQECPGNKPVWKKKRFIFGLLALFFLLLLFGNRIEASQAPELDRKNLKSNIIERVKKMTGASVTPDQIDLEIVEQAPAGDLMLYAVKAIVELQGESAPMYLLVDPEGQRQFMDIQDVATGHSFVEKIMQSIIDTDTPEVSMDGWGDPVFVGDGDVKVVAVSDPFCPYCRDAWNFLQDRKEDIGELVISHLPLSEASFHATMLVEYAKESKLLDAEQAVDFIYSFPQIGSDNPGLELAKMALEAFPQLNDEFESAKDMASALEEKYTPEVQAQAKKAQDQGITGTPAFIINGQMINGFNQSAIDKALN